MPELARVLDTLKNSDGSLASGRIGPYTVQAAIAAVHAEAPDAASTDWPRIVSKRSCCSN